MARIAQPEFMYTCRYVVSEAFAAPVVPDVKMIEWISHTSRSRLSSGGTIDPERSSWGVTRRAVAPMTSRRSDRLSSTITTSLWTV
jgi:hypothetical protein